MNAIARSLYSMGNAQQLGVVISPRYWLIGNVVRVNVSVCVCASIQERAPSDGQRRESQSLSL